MPSSKPDTSPDDRLTAEEMGRQPQEPWLPAETLLVVGSLILGTLLLGLLLWASSTFFPTL